jgi:CheY-like chemotaxis protein
MSALYHVVASRLVSGLLRFDVTAATVARALFDGAPDAILVSDGADVIVDVNAAALRKFGGVREDLVGKPLEAAVRGREVVRVPCEIDGEKFFLSFVREQAAEEPAPAPSNEGNRFTVLVVDDDPQVRWAIESVLSRAGYRVVAAHNADDAVTIAKDIIVHALVTDLVLPGLSGLALASAVLAFRPDTKVLYVSGMHQVSADRLQPGTAFLPKPFAPAELLDQLRSLLA